MNKKINRIKKKISSRAESKVLQGGEEETALPDMRPAFIVI